MHRPLLAVLAATTTLFAACGGDDGDSATSPEPARTTPVAADDFPSSKGKTLADLQQGIPEGPVLAPSVSVLTPGRENRFGFALFDRARKQLNGAQVALYVARKDGTGLRGPFLARSESLKVRSQFASRQTAEDPDSARSVYVADLPLPKGRGSVIVYALAMLDGRMVTTGPLEQPVGSRGATPPAVGDKAPVISTETVTDAGGDLTKITTRLPPAKSVLEDDFSDVVGKKPIVLMFTTPQLCQTKVCGPVLDVGLQVQSQAGDAVSFIQQEIYRENEIAKGLRPQLAKYRLVSEPWTFVVDRTGVISDRFEGAVSVEELERAVAKVRD